MSAVVQEGVGTGCNIKLTPVVIPYKPRKHFIPLHRSIKRFMFSVAHRRAGKSVSQINHIIRAALRNERVYPPPRYAYVGPSFAQTKDLIWGYLKHYAGALNVPGEEPVVKFLEGDLQCILPNGALINLYGGAAAYERMRGLYFDGIVLDEFPLLNPAVFSTVVRPCLADYRGWAIVSGTSNGDDHFHELKKRAEKDPEGWDVFSIPVTETDALHPDEVQEMTKDMSPEEYAREMLCRFDAPVEGAYYAYLINAAEQATPPRITKVSFDSSAQVFTWWDLGMDDEMAIWIMQRAGNELHAIDFLQGSGKGLAHYSKLLRGEPIDGVPFDYEHRQQYSYGVHVYPHDIAVRELGTGVSRLETMHKLWPNAQHFTAPKLSPEDGINAVKQIIPLTWFDMELTSSGISALRNYHKNPKTGQPVHNWASHPSDAFRTGAVALNQVFGFMGSTTVVSFNRQGTLRRRIRGMV